MPGPITEFVLRDGPKWNFTTRPGFDTSPQVLGVTPNSARITGGQTITITGTNFIINALGGGLSASLKGIALTIISATRTQIVATIPISTFTSDDVGPADIVVTNSYGQSGTLAGSFTLFTATIISLSPSHGTFNGGTTVILNGYNFDVGLTYRVLFGNDAATNVIVIDSQHISVVTPAHSVGFVDITLESPSSMFDPAIFDPVIFDDSAVDPTIYSTLRSGFQYTLLTRGDDIRRQPGITIQDVLNNTPNTCTFTIDGSSNVPLIGEKIEITDSFDSNRRLFAGTVQQVTQIYEGQTDQLAFQVQCIDFTFLMNRKRPFGYYNNVSASDVVKDLIANYAPGFTTAHVQTNLAKVTATFDGSVDLVTALTQLATSIGGGHWYVDYDQDVHFFHVVPASLNLPPSEFQDLGAHMTISAGPGISVASNFYTAGYYFLRYTFVYSDGTESQFGSISNILLLDGTDRIHVAGLPCGTNKGTLTCIKRRIYYNAFLPSYIGSSPSGGGHPLDPTPIELIKQYAEVADNTTTSFESDFGFHNASVASVQAFQTSTPQNVPPSVAPTVAVANPYPSSQSHTPYSGAPFTFGYTFIFTDGSESVLSPTTLLAENNGTSGWDCTISVGGANVTARRLYIKISGSWRYLQINDNTTTLIQNKSIGGNGIPIATPSAPTPVSAPGPYLVALVAFDQFGGTTIGAAASGVLGGGALTTWRTPADFNSTGTAVSGAAYVSKDGGASWHSANAQVPAGPNLQFPIYGTDFVFGDTFYPPTSNTTGGVPFALYTNVNLVLASGSSSDPNTYGVGAPPLSTTAIPNVSFTGHPAAPSTGPNAVVDTTTGAGFWNGGIFQFKVAYIYRDGSVSFPSPASASAGIRNNIKGTGIIGWSLYNLPIGPTINNNDVVARIVYYALGLLADPNYSISWPGSGPADGFVWPIPSLDPDWTSAVGGIVVIPNNVDTKLEHFSLAALGTDQSQWNSAYVDVALLVGPGNLPYNNGTILSSDPIPIWPNPDGPSLEDVDPPDDLTDDNPDLLHGDSGSQQFEVTSDLSQVRNRVFVVGSGSIAVATAAAGINKIQVNDITSFSPSGGRVKIEDPTTGKHQIVTYNGVSGVVGTTYIELAAGLQYQVVQGSIINNFFQADDFDSQKFLAKAELDTNGNPTDGIHEYTVVDTSLKAHWQLFMRAYAELELFSKPIVQIKYATRDPKSRSGQMVHVDMSTPPCQGDFLIQSVQIDQIHDEADMLMPRYTVMAASTKFELNDLLLQILGNKIGGGTGGSGVVASAVTTTVDTNTNQGTDTRLPNPAGLRRKFGGGTIRSGTSIDQYGFGLTSSINTSGVSAGQTDTFPGIGGVSSNWVRFTPANNNGNLCGYSTVATVLWENRPKFICRFRTANILYGIGLPSTSHRVYWFGISTNGQPGTGGTTVLTVPHVMVMVDIVGSEPATATMQLSVGSVGGQVFSNPGFPTFRTNTQYQVQIEWLTSTTAKITVVDVTNNVSVVKTTPVSGFNSPDIPGTGAVDQFKGYCYGSTPVMVASTSYIDISDLYLESD